MNTNNYTIKSQEALQQAVQLAQSKGQQAIETGHLLEGVIHVGENITQFIFNKLGVNSHNLMAALDRMVIVIRKYPEGNLTYPVTAIKPWRKLPVWPKRWEISMFPWSISF